MKKRDEKLELMEVLPRREEVFFCEDPGRMDIWDKPMDNVHIEVRSKEKQTWYYCYGDIDGVSTCFGAELTLEGAYQVIKGLIPAEYVAGKKAEHPVPKDVLEEVPADASRWVKVSFCVDSEELHEFVSVYDDWEELRCQVLDVQHLGLNIPELYYMLAITGLNTMRLEMANFEHILENAESSDDDLLLDDLEHQRLKEETRQAYLNGGRTGYLYDIDGNEYYTTRDGVRHYTRVEG